MKGDGIYFTPVELAELDYIVKRYWCDYDETKTKGEKKVVHKLKDKIESKYSRIANEIVEESREAFGYDEESKKAFGFI